MTREPLNQDRPFLGGHHVRLQDLARLEGSGVVDSVLFTKLAASDLNEELRLLAELQAAVSVKT